VGFEVVIVLEVGVLLEASNEALVKRILGQVLWDKTSDLKVLLEYYIYESS